MTHDDRTISTMDYDYEAAFGGGDSAMWSSVSEVGGTVGLHVRHTCLDDVVHGTEVEMMLKFCWSKRRQLTIKA